MINEITLDDIKDYYLEAKKSGLLFCKTTKLYGLYIGNDLVGFTGIIFNKNKATFKNHYVINKHRGKGYFKQMFIFSINLCKSKDIKVIEAVCTKMSINTYYDYGFKPVKRYKHLVKVRYENL